ncbi:MAG: N-formylglutamate amidohydrolase, partial [Alphaproteobacteria bacterium]|nr:N-formylglutamate amidohydrolase [Alphaproteobacteria bacterium]
PAYVNSYSPRVRAGLGTIARLVGAQLPIYREKLSFAEAEARIAAVYKPFHNKLKSLLDAAQATHGTAFLLDIHSMPSALPTPQPAHRPSIQKQDKAAFMPDIILGDRHGTSCHPALTQSVKAYFTDCGYNTICNKFYTGGYITAHYGQPSQHRHALQIEIARRLYMDEKTYAPLDTLAQLKADLSGLLKHLRKKENTLLATINKHANQARPAAE